MKFLYATDLHGNKDKYEDVFQKAVEHNIDLIHIGADILPKGSSILRKQKRFIKGFLKEFYEKCQDKNIEVLAFFGNDDIYTRKKYFQEYAQLLDEHPFSKEGHTFSAYGYVPDYPFGLKTACKSDFEGWVLKEPYISSPIDVGPKGFIPIFDIDAYFKNKGTIEEDLKKFKGTPETIAAIHSPPRDLGLDVCSGDIKVGSQAVYNWIKEKQPLLVLCGHIHESPEESGIWKANLGDTLIIQPGQEENKNVIVLIEIEGKKINASLI